MRALITGGAGFIGSHLAEALLARGDTVVAVDNLATGRFDNVASFEQHARFELVVDTILDEALVDRVVREVDVVFHLASAVGVQLIIDQPVRTIDTNVKGTDLILRMARRYRRPIVITSSSEVYGKGTRVPFREDDDVVLGPSTTRRWSYACSKLLDEFMALAHWHETQLPVVCVRLFNTVGPRQTGQYGMVLPRFIEQAAAETPITVYGDGEQSRCFCHVADVVTALIDLLSCQEAYGRVVNIGASDEITIRGLAERVRDLAGSSSDIVLVPYDQAYVAGFEDMRRRVPDLTLARTLIDYAPRHGLDDIIRSILRERQPEHSG